MTGAAPDQDRRHATPTGGLDEPGERQVPFYCPYCGDQDLRPHGPEVGGWRCGACSRVFRLRFSGVARPSWDMP
jgi:predicted RNA-binding Zn-ribbon protein involved in translation (DUF1610 family)